MQNPPRLPQIRGTFIAAPGYELGEVDLSQAELRVIGALSGCPVMREIYNTGGDIHAELCKELFPGWHPKREGAKEQRVKAKNVNFGIPYGISKFGLAEQIHSDVGEAQWMLDGWNQRFPVAREFLDKCRDTPKKGQVITTCFGRKKRVQLVQGRTLAS
jgi:DNA polymerase-1